MFLYDVSCSMHWKNIACYHIILSIPGSCSCGTWKNHISHDWHTSKLLRAAILIDTLEVNHHWKNTVDGRNAKQQPGMYKTCKECDKLPTSTGDRRISEPSTVWCFPFDDKLLRNRKWWPRTSDIIVGPKKNIVNRAPLISKSPSLLSRSCQCKRSEWAESPWPRPLASWSRDRAPTVALQTTSCPSESERPRSARLPRDGHPYWHSTSAPIQ